MTDYLTNLIARNLEMMEVIQPRLASRFEPSSPASGSWQGGSSWGGDTGEAPLSAESASIPPGLQKSPAPPSERSLESQRPFREFQENLAPPPQQQQNFIPDKSPARRPAQPPGRRSPGGATARSAGARDEEVAVRTSEDLANAKLQQPLKAPAYTEQVPVTPASPENPTISASSEGGKQKDPVSSDHYILPALAERTSPAGSGELPEASLVPAKPKATPGADVPRPQVAPYVQAPPAPLAEPKGMPQTAPVIRVTIGRVEVRAVMAPQAPPPPRPQARPEPSLSLKDYLKEREGGKR